MSIFLLPSSDERRLRDTHHNMVALATRYPGFITDVQYHPSQQLVQLTLHGAPTEALTIQLHVKRQAVVAYTMDRRRHALSASSLIEQWIRRYQAWWEEQHDDADPRERG